MPNGQVDDVLSAFSNNMQILIDHAGKDITIWFNINLAITVAVLLLGLAVTLITALQTEENQKILKPYVVSLAILLSTASSLTNVFHTQDNLRVAADTFINTKQLKYDFDMARLDGKDGFDKQDLQNNYNKKYVEIYRRFMTAFTYFAAPESGSNTVSTTGSLSTPQKQDGSGQTDVQPAGKTGEKS